MRTKFIFTLLASAAIFASCASKDLIVFNGKVDLQSIYYTPPTDRMPSIPGPTDSGFNGYAVIISEDGKRYNIWPKTLEERLRNNSSIKKHVIRFTVRPHKKIDGYGLIHVDGTVAPLSWEILDSEGEIAKDHYLRKSRWKIWNKLNLDPQKRWVFEAVPVDGRPRRPHIP
jgi:hypothetical protein